MLISLESDLPNGKNAAFEPGVNIALAIRTRQARAKDSRNAVGKSSFVGTLDFCLGSSAGVKHILRRPETEQGTFALTLAWADSQHVIARTGLEPNKPQLDSSELGLTALRQYLGAGLFNLTSSEQEPSFRALMSYYLRSQSDGAFADPLRVFSRQSDISTQSPLAYLLGLDAGLVQRAKEISDSKKSLTALRAATKDPVFGQAFGTEDELAAQIATLLVRQSQLENAIRSFRVVDQYTEKRREAEDFSAAIRTANERAILLDQRVRDLSDALETEEIDQPDHNYLEGIYNQVGLIFPTVARRNIDEVNEFHRSVVRNRKLYLAQERTEALAAAEEMRNRVQFLDEQRAGLMRILSQGGALETYSELLQELGEIRGKLEGLEQRRAAVESLREARAHLNRQSLDLQESVRRDLVERRSSIQQMSELFTRFAFAIYGSKRPAALTIREQETGYQLSPTIGGDRSAGVKSMAIFCFDLTMAVVAKRSGRGPDFLVHDSHLFDSVEARQLANALALAEQVCEAEDMQYVATLNSDTLESAESTKVRFDFHQCLELTDQYETGGFFGTRFN